MSDPRKDNAQKPAGPKQDEAELSDEALEQVAGGLPVTQIETPGIAGEGLDEIDFVG